VTVRRAVLADAPAIAKLAVQAWPETPFQTPMPSAAFMVSAMQRVASDERQAAFLLLDEAEEPMGIFAGIHFQHPFAGHQIVSELMLWVAPEARGYGLQLLAAAEDWARARQADELHCYAHTPDLERLYALAKFRPLERTYVRDLR